MAEYHITLREDNGTALTDIKTFSRLYYSRVANAVGTLEISLPGTFDRSLFVPDRRLDVYRNGRRERVYFLRGVLYVTEENGNRRTVLTGRCSNYLLTSRIVAYPAGSIQAKQTDFGDDMIKAVVNQNFSTSATDSARQIAAAYLTIEGDTSLGPTLTNQTFPRENVLKVVQQLAEACRGGGTPIYFDLYAVDDSLFQFRTMKSQPGMDHTYPNGIGPVLIGPDYGNLVEATLKYDYDDEATYVYAGWKGEGADRNVQTTSDTTRLNRSLFSRREVWIDASQEPSATAALDRAKGRLVEGRPNLRFFGRLQGDGYGSQWDFGDKVSAFYEDRQYDCIVKAVEVTVEPKSEKIMAHLEYIE